MTDIEMLREAARLMRERAQAATPSPTEEPYGWAGHSGTIGAAIYGGPAENGYRTSTVLAVEPYCTACRQPTDADVQHIASWHPAVGLAIADLLESVAADYKTFTDRGECPSCDTGYCRHPLLTIHQDCDEPVEQCQCIAPFLPVARAYLGVPA